MHQVIFQRLWTCQINNGLKPIGGYIVWTQCPARGFSCRLFFCSAGVLPSWATSALRLAVNIIFVVHWASLTSGSTSMSSIDSLRVVTCSFNSYTFERMAEIASVSAGVLCFDVFSSLRYAMSIWQEISPTMLGQSNAVVFSFPTALACKSGFCESTTLTFRYFLRIFQ